MPAPEKSWQVTNSSTMFESKVGDALLSHKKFLGFCHEQAQNILHLNRYKVVKSSIIDLGVCAVWRLKLMKRSPSDDTQRMMAKRVFRRAGKRSGLKRSAPRVLKIKPRWLKLIVEGKKTWEIRNNGLKQLGPVHLSSSGTTDIVATCTISSCVRLTSGIFNENMAKHCLSSWCEVKYKNPYAWVLTNLSRVDPPLKYKHKDGAVIFISLR